MAKYHKNDPKTIQEMFGSIAASYDRTNAVLSFGLHHKWNAALVKTVLGNNQPDSYLDLCSGTGEIVFNFIKKADKPTDIFLLDFCEEMLQCAKAKASLKSNKHHLSYIQADAQSIPLTNHSVECATIAYGIRNVKEPSKCINDVFRVLKPGGNFAILELTRPTNPVLRFGHHIYLRTLLPLLGWCFSANQSAYEYLCSSIHTFVEPSEVEHLLANAGFEEISRKSLSGGVATILFAKKPL